MMTPDEIARLAAMGSSLRPDWPSTSLRTFVERHLTHRAYGDTAVALAWVATKTKTTTPRLLLEPGAWWQAALSDGAMAPVREPFDPRTFCGICGQPESRCRRNEHNDHPFISKHDHDRQLATEPRREGDRSA